MARLKPIVRDRHLTPEEAAREQAMRDEVMEEVPPIRPPLVRRAAVPWFSVIPQRMTMWPWCTRRLTTIRFVRSRPTLSRSNARWRG